MLGGGYRDRVIWGCAGDVRAWGLGILPPKSESEENMEPERDNCFYRGSARV